MEDQITDIIKESIKYNIEGHCFDRTHCTITVKKIMDIIEIEMLEKDDYITSLESDIENLECEIKELNSK